MDTATLIEAMSYPGYPAPTADVNFAAWVPSTIVALREAGCTTVARAAMFLAQVGAECGSLRWPQELADGTAYDRYLNPSGPWQQLGNTQRGDGARFKGRSFIQITGRHNYTALSQWAHRAGRVPSATYFVDHPDDLAGLQYAWLGPVWYWVVARPQLNKLADAHDIVGATRAVNGGLNNLQGRTARWTKCLSLGAAILPPAPTPSLIGESTVFQLLRDAQTHIWYAWSPGFWMRLRTQAQINAAAASPLCANSKQALAALKAGPGKGFTAITVPHSDVQTCHNIATGNEVHA